MYELIERYMEQAFRLVSESERRSNPSLGHYQAQMRKTLGTLKELSLAGKGVIEKTSAVSPDDVKKAAND